RRPHAQSIRGRPRKPWLRPLYNRRRDAHHGQRQALSDRLWGHGGVVHPIPRPRSEIRGRRAERRAPGPLRVRAHPSGRGGPAGAGAGCGGRVMPTAPADPRTGPSGQSQDAARWRRERLARSRLYVVTGARRDQGDLEDFLETILQAGTDVIQLREKDAEGGDLLRWGEVFLAAARRHGALFVVNDRPDVAAALEADGVHVGQNDLPPAVTRRLVGPAMIIGLSTH